MSAAGGQTPPSAGQPQGGEGVVPDLSEQEFLIRAREAAIQCLDRSATMSAGASESSRVAYRLGHRDNFADGLIAAIRYFWRDLALPLSEIQHQPDSAILAARHMAAQEAVNAWPDDEQRATAEGQAFLSGLRDDFPAVKYRAEGMRSVSGSGVA